MKHKSLSAIIVTYNNGHQIRACLTSLQCQSQPQEIILIDNNSKDKTREHIEIFHQENKTFPLHCIWNNRNVGFARAVNQGLVNVTGEFTLLLTPDAELLPDALKSLMDFMHRNPDAAMTAPQLLTPQSDIQPSCRRFPTYRDLILELTGIPRLIPRKIPSRWKMDDFDHQSIREVEQLEATCMLIRATILQKVGLMDECFPIFFNDVDWCKKFQFKRTEDLFCAPGPGNPQSGNQCLGESGGHDLEITSRILSVLSKILYFDET